VRLAFDLRVEGAVATENNHCLIVYVLTTSRHGLLTAAPRPGELRAQPLPSRFHRSGYSPVDSHDVGRKACSHGRIGKYPQPDSNR